MFNYMECPICLKNIIDIEKSITNCDHIFCYDCLNSWLKKKNVSCPMCRKDIISFKHNNEINRIIYINPQQNVNNVNNPVTNNPVPNNRNPNNRNITLSKKKYLLLKALSSCSLLFFITSMYLLIENETIINELASSHG